MPRRKFIDKKTAANFRLVHRAQNDPRIHDEDAPQMVFAETTAANLREPDQPAGSSRVSQYSAATGRSKIRSRRDLEGEYASRVRNNEGEAANHGIFYDDSEYDYMQHMRDLDTGTGNAYFIEAPGEKKKGKKQFDLADALSNTSLSENRSEAGLSMSSNMSSVSDIFGEDMAPSEFVRKTTYQDQQNIPDAIAGFQPDMDPRLREVLEALEDDAYVDDEDAIFTELAADGFEVDHREWDESGYEENGDTMDRFLDEDDQGWETDDTVKASSPKDKSKTKSPAEVTPPATLPAPNEAPAPADANDLAYLEEFNKFKNDTKASKPSKPIAASGAPSSILTGTSAFTAGGRRKKRKGAKTSTSNYSMSSSALYRTEGLTLLDQRFDKIEEEYSHDIFDFPDDASMASGMSRMSGMSRVSGVSKLSSMSKVSGWSGSEAPQLRSDFDNIMDDFLGSHRMQGKRRIGKGKQMTGLEQLDEIREELGPARVSRLKTKAV